MAQQDRDEPDARAHADAPWMTTEPLEGVEGAGTVRDLDGIEVAVIGAGLSGLASARVLSMRGARVTVFDKGQVPGGRMSQRSDRGHRFDHGAQFFTARSRALAAEVEAWIAAGVVARWSPRTGGDGARPRGAHDPMLVATPGMNAVALALAATCDVRRGVRIARVVARGARLAIEDDKGTERARVDRVVVAVPAPQAAGLLLEAPALATRARAVTMSPCWALMLAFERPLAVPFDVARYESGAIAWVARDSAKPGRDGSNGETWVAHAGVAWSLAHLEDDVPAATSALLAAFRDRVDASAMEPRLAHAHRWRFARTESPLGEPCMVDGAGRIAVCGDWCLGARVEHAYVSGLAAGRAIARA